MSKGSGKGSSGSAKSNSGTGTPMTKEAASRIQSVGDRHPQSQTAKDGFASRAQSVADQKK